MRLSEVEDFTFFVPYSDVPLTYACDKTVGKLCYVLPLKSFVIILT